MVNKGTWVSLRKTILEPAERAEGIPAETAATPLIMWVSGFLESDAQIGSEAEIRTKMNRTEIGILEEVNPNTTINYGDFIPEIMAISATAREVLNG